MNSDRIGENKSVNHSRGSVLDQQIDFNKVQKIGNLKNVINESHRDSEKSVQKSMLNSSIAMSN